MTRFHRHAARGLGLVLHRLATLALGAAVIGAVLVAGAAWRLSKGPVDIGWFTHRLEAAVNGDGGPIRLAIGGTALAWEGFRLGVDRPLDLRLTDIVLSDRAGVRHVAIPRAEVSLSLTALLRGRVQPRGLEVDQPRLAVIRAESGALRIDLGAPPAPAAAPSGGGGGIGGSLPALLGLLAKPPQTDRTAGPAWFSQLRRVRIHDAAVTVIDRPLDAIWQVPRAEVTLDRQARGGIDGTLDVALALGDQQARLTASATLSADASQTHLVARLSQIEPAALARAAPRLKPLAAIDAPVRFQATADLGPALDLRAAQVTAEAGAGVVHIGAGAVPLLDAHVTASGTAEAMRLDVAQLRLQGPSAAVPTVLTATGELHRADGRIDGDVSIDLDQVAFADLPSLWPPGVGGGARPWVLENITAGVAHDAHVSIGLAANGDLSGLTVTRATGALQGTGLSVSWLRPVPPIVQGNAVLRILDPDTLQIDVASGREQLARGALAVSNGSLRITGLMQKDQTATLAFDVSGTLADTIALLREQRLGLLSAHPIALNDPAGAVTASVAATVPLENKVTMDEIPIRVAAHVDQAALSGLVAGRDLSHGVLDLVATNDGLTVKGQAALAGIPATLDAAMDFRAGPPDQVLQRIAVSGQPDARQLAAAGLDPTDLLTGPIGLHAVLTEQRDGTGTVAVNADLAKARLTVAPLNWRGDLGDGAQAAVTVRLEHDKLAGIDNIAANGRGLLVRSSAQYTDGRISGVVIQRAVLGRSEFSGSIGFPAVPGQGPIVVQVHGPVLDLQPRLEQPKSGGHAPARKDEAAGPAWTLDARFDQVLVAHGYLLAPVSVQADNDGRVFRRLSVAGATGARAPFRMAIVPDGSRRWLTASVAQTGDLLRALDVTDTLQGGTLTVNGSYDDASLEHPLQGTAELTDFHVLHAVALGKLLQAMTLYGLMDALRGPGIAFTRMVAPFRLADGRLTLADARAFSPSLGLTAKGLVDLDGNAIDLQGTIVPAYFFNSLLGNVPLVGRLFSPERGGGIFAASYALRGKLDDPDVHVNALTALTPGFLRGLFRLF